MKKWDKIFKPVGIEVQNVKWRPLDNLKFKIQHSTFPKLQHSSNACAINV